MEQKHIVLAGAGMMGASLAQVYAQAGYRVSLWNGSESGLDRARNLIALNQETLRKEEMVTPEQSEELVKRITYTTSKACMEDCDLMVEAIIENMDAKHKFWEEASRIAPENALLATNTSGLLITEVAKPVYRPERFMGQHWLNPPHLLPLCEIIRGEKTEETYLQQMYELVKGLGKKPVIVKKDVNGFILNRLQYAVLREALYIVENGNAVQSIADLAGKTIYSTGKGTTPEYVLNYILSENGIDPQTDVTVEYKSEATEVLATMQAAEQGAIAVLPQPYVTAAQAQVEGLTVALDLTQEWNKVNADSDLITGVLVVRKEFAEQNPQQVQAFLQDYKNSITWVNENTEQAAQLVADYGIVAKAALAQKALPACNLTYLDGSDMKQKLSGYLQVLYEQNPEAVGGSMPGDDFYYGA